MKFSSSLRSQSKGAVLVEFAFGALVFFATVLGALEWSLEVYVRHATERHVSAMSRVYSSDRNLESAMDAGAREVGFITRLCAHTADIRLYDSILGVDLSDPNSGYEPTNTSADDLAVFARLEMTCEWSRLTPLAAALFGDHLQYSVIGLTKLQ